MSPFRLLATFGQVDPTLSYAEGAPSSGLETWGQEERSLQFLNRAKRNMRKLPVCPLFEKIRPLSNQPPSTLPHRPLAP